MRESNANTKETCGYAPINGLKMYFEIEGAGDPLVYIPPVFGYAGLKSFPELVEKPFGHYSRSPGAWSHGGYPGASNDIGAKRQ
jgi:hypothetical protein